MSLRNVIILLIALAVLLPAATEAQQPTTPGGQGGGDADGARRGPPGGVDQGARADAAAAGWQNLSAEKREMAGQRAEQARLFAMLSLEGGAATGRFVSFFVDPANGAVTEYTALSGDNETRFFDLVTLPAFAEPRVAGAVLQSVGDDVLVFAYNNPTAQLRVVATDAPLTVEFDLGDGVTPGNVTNHSLRLVAGAAHGHILLAGGGNITQEEEGLVRVELEPHASALFLNHPSRPTVTAAALHEEIEAITAGRLGAKLSVVNASGEPAEVATEFGVSIRTRTIEAGRAVVTVGSDVDEPRAVVINTGQDTLNATRPEQVNVTIDGEAATRVSSAAEVLAGAPGQGATFAVDIVEGAVQVTVNVPSFSEHDIAITTSEPAAGDDGTTEPTTGGTTDGTQPTVDGKTPEDEQAGNGADTPGLPLAAALVALALVARFRRRT